MGVGHFKINAQTITCSGHAPPWTIYSATVKWLLLGGCLTSKAVKTPKSRNISLKRR